MAVMVIRIANPIRNDDVVFSCTEWPSNNLGVDDNCAASLTPQSAPSL
jgi:hypothetical protein